MDKYIADLLKKPIRELDLYMIAEIQESVGLEYVNKQQEADFNEENYKIKWAELRINSRGELLKADPKAKITEAMLDDIVHASTEWQEFIKMYITSKRQANEMKQKVKKWENFYTAKMSLEATQRRVNVL